MFEVLVEGFPWSGAMTVGPQWVADFGSRQHDGDQVVAQGSSQRSLSSEMPLSLPSPISPIDLPEGASPLSFPLLPPRSRISGLSSVHLVGS